MINFVLMLTLRLAQLSALSVISEAGAEDRAIRHLRNCIPEACDAMSEDELRETVAWGRKRSRHYGIDRESDFFRYLNLMFMFGFEFDTSPRYPWAARALNGSGSARARVDLLMDHAMLYCSQVSAAAAEGDSNR